MKHLDFILWMVLFPVSISVCNYIDALKYKSNGFRKEYSKESEGYVAIAIIVLWLFIGIKLF